ncbi:hypothetical protein PR048_033307 [Dryococelus australis]|uniref:Uncharacterized protein n=1 Tax=Dryococelus australis TaxID=614101 RepID=A0ABQ9FZY0_9NEOP|nr:hypothetical protein PR048_033307 [Dryococelus australis]
MVGGNAENPTITKSGDRVWYCSSESIVYVQNSVTPLDCQNIKECVTLSEDCDAPRAKEQLRRSFKFRSTALVEINRLRIVYGWKGHLKRNPVIPHKTPYDRVKLCREREINIKASERVNADYGAVEKIVRLGCYLSLGVPSHCLLHRPSTFIGVFGFPYSQMVSGVVWTNRTMVCSNTDTNRTGVLAVAGTVENEMSSHADARPITEGNLQACPKEKSSLSMNLFAKNRRGKITKIPDRKLLSHSSRLRPPPPPPRSAIAGTLTCAAYKGQPTRICAANRSQSAPASTPVAPSTSTALGMTPAPTVDVSPAQTEQLFSKMKSSHLRPEDRQL